MFTNKWVGDEKEAIENYKMLLRDTDLFNGVLELVEKYWPISCEHFLTKPSMNRIAWLGQASLSFYFGIERKYKIAFKDLTDNEQTNANSTARNFLEIFSTKLSNASSTSSMNGTEFSHFEYSGLPSRLKTYEEVWKNRGYPNGIPDEVPSELMNLRLAPSWKAVSIALLKNDVGLYSLGFAQKKSEYYSMLKRIELKGRANKLLKV